MKLLLDSGYQWEPQTLDCLVVYLAGHNRPVHEVLFPNSKPLDAIFENEFEGMTIDAVDVAELEAVRVRIPNELPRALLSRQRDFLLSMARAPPPPQPAAPCHASASTTASASNAGRANQ